MVLPLHDPPELDDLFPDRIGEVQGVVDLHIIDIHFLKDALWTHGTFRAGATSAGALAFKLLPRSAEIVVKARRTIRVLACDAIEGVPSDINHAARA
jgi:hypothetical protein